MNKSELLNLLTTMREHYRDKGGCKILSLGSGCQCALCSIENAMVRVETMKDDVTVEMKIDIFVKPVIPVDFIELRLTY
jgi:hypothetical protein